MSWSISIAFCPVFLNNQELYGVASFLTCSHMWSGSDPALGSERTVDKSMPRESVSSLHASSRIQTSCLHKDLKPISTNHVLHILSTNLSLKSRIFSVRSACPHRSRGCWHFSLRKLLSRRTWTGRRTGGRPVEKAPPKGKGTCCRSGQRPTARSSEESEMLRFGASLPHHLTHLISPCKLRSWRHVLSCGIIVAAVDCSSSAVLLSRASQLRWALICHTERLDLESLSSRYCSNNRVQM